MDTRRCQLELDRRVLHAILDLRRGGLTTVAIAHAVNVPERCLRRWLSRARRGDRAIYRELATGWRDAQLERDECVQELVNAVRERLR